MMGVWWGLPPLLAAWLGDARLRGYGFAQYKRYLYRAQFREVVPP